MNDKTFIAKHIQKKLDDGFYTPDQPALNRLKKVPIFVYGTLKKGYPLDEYLKDAEFYSGAMTIKNNFKMCVTQNPRRMNFPVVFRSEAYDAGHISGEIYFVSPDMIPQLDFLEMNTISYHRDLVGVELNDFRHPKGGKMFCYTYIGDNAWWHDRILKGEVQPVPVLARKKNPNYRYYYFMKPMCQPTTYKDFQNQLNQENRAL